MSSDSKLAKFFRLDDEGWMKHANPLSVYTRYSVLPLIALAFWTRIWIGWWSLIPGILSIVWMFVNPTLFKNAKSTKNWASKCVLGERVWGNKKKVEVPMHHRKMPHLLNLINAIGFFTAIWGIIVLDLWFTIFGTVVTILAKSWYLDRMVWLYEEMKHIPEYGKWLY
jgi:hypothetical protein